ncbi:MAG: DUF2975 domain-containing protein [Bacteroidales bacterium]|nr:DUF2975 domain-containing protein [Bacteroidales bacterium]
MWLLYGLFFFIMLLCVALFMGNVVTAADSYHFDNLRSQLHGEDRYGLMITDLHMKDKVKQDVLVDGVTKDSTDVYARVNTFDITLVSPDEASVYPSQIRWTLALQVFAVVAFLAIFVCVVVLLFSFYKAIRQWRIFRKSSVLWIRLIGVLMMLMSLALDVSTYMERQYASQWLQDTAWTIDSGFTLHFTRLFFGIIILFVGELLKLGYAMQEEQDLTI